MRREVVSPTREERTARDHRRDRGSSGWPSAHETSASPRQSERGGDGKGYATRTPLGATRSQTPSRDELVAPLVSIESGAN